MSKSRENMKDTISVRTRHRSRRKEDTRWKNAAEQNIRINEYLVTQFYFIDSLNTTLLFSGY